MKKIACLFPGIGYTCDRPLLYYSAKMLGNLGWEVVPVPYSGFPGQVRGNPGRMRQCAETALDQAETILQNIRWQDYPDILFVGKSVGTVVCSAYAEQHGLPCRMVLFTPVKETFQFSPKPSCAFHGTKDPWADTAVVVECCRRMGIPLHLTEGANHSLETGDIDRDIKELRKIMKKVREFITEGGQPAGISGLSGPERKIRLEGESGA